MNYTKLKYNLEKYGRDNTYAYVCDSYKPRLRQDKKYRQWRRLIDKVSSKTMTAHEKEILRNLLEIKVTFLQELFCNK